MSRLIKIKAQDFMKSFKEEWNTDPSIRKNFSYEYMKKPKCSRLMLKPGGFINRVMERLQLIEPNLRYKQECYTVDALYVGGKDLYGENLSYPSEIHVVIEHEFGNNVEEEMWKLLFWRAPLKVLILYDWPEEEKTTDLKKNWLTKKLQLLVGMIEEVNNFFEENLSSEYLFIIGKQKVAGSIEWHWSLNNTCRLAKL